MDQESRHQIQVSIKNCNNIISFDMNLFRDELNLRYALNGTGKSTISKSIHHHVSGVSLDSLKPFGSDVKPSVEISEKLSDVLIFNEDFVNNTVFNESEVIENGFEVFLKSEDYDSRVESLTQKIRSLKDGIQENQVYESLYQSLSNISQKLKLNTDGITVKNDPILKSLISYNNQFRIPPELEEYRPFLENKDLNIDWIDWKDKGGKYDEVSGCPFCTKTFDEGYKSKKDTFQKSYKKSGAKNLKDMLDLFEQIQEYLDEKKYNLIIGCIKTDSDPDTTTQVLTKFRIEIEGVLTNFGKLSRFNQLEITRDQISNIGEVLEGTKIVVESLDYLKSTKSLGLFSEINKKIDDLVSIVGDLKSEIGSFYGFVQSTISDVKTDINDFLCKAGINYELEILQEESENIKTILRYVNPFNERIDVDKIVDHLSWGEKNAFSLVLFMYYALSKNPDLIILDDPISSFDDNKKYSIINHLFRSGGSQRSLYRKSVLMLSHDFEPIIDFVVNNKPTGGFVNAEYLRNRNGDIVANRIERGDVQSWVSLLRKYSMDPDLCIVNRLAFLRKYIELIKESSEHRFGYEIISSLQHGYPVPKIKRGDSLYDLVDEESEKGTDFIKRFITDFDYPTILTKITDVNELKSYYEDHENNYLKLQVFRSYLETSGTRDKIQDDNLVKYIDETYHIENDYIYFLDISEYELVPDHIIQGCDNHILK